MKMIEVMHLYSWENYALFCVDNKNMISYKVFR